MTTIREVLHKDPTTSDIPNLGVAKVGVPQTSEEWDVLKWELQSFVCDGEYRRGLERILATYLGRIAQAQQPAVWVSGFYGSGKSHFVRVLDSLWRDVAFPDGATARGLASLPEEITDHLKELATAGRQTGGLWSAAGTLGAGAGGSVRLAMLGILFRAAGLPEQFPPARFVIWLKQNNYFEAVKSGVERRGKSLAKELNNLYVSPPLAQSLLEAVPDYAAGVGEAHTLLAQQYPNRDEITNDEFLAAVEDVLALRSTAPDRLPCALLVFDELQQFLAGDLRRIAEVQQSVEACSSRFGSKLLFVATGQAALGSTPELQRLQDRFAVAVTLSDSDVEKVVRGVVLRKVPDKIGTRIAARPADRPDLVSDYPLLPTRRRFWEAFLRSVESAGKVGQLRAQLRIVHETTKAIAERPLGWVVAGDVIYDQLEADLQMTGILHRDTATRIREEDDGTEEGRLRARICALVFLIGKLETEGVGATGLKATAETLADLLVEDLNAGSTALRQKLPDLLSGLVDRGMLMVVEGEYRLQTRESAEWEQDFRRHFSRIVNDDGRIADDRATELRTAFATAIKDIRLVQGVSKTLRKMEPHFGQDQPPQHTGGVPVWVRDEWSVTERDVRGDAQAAGTESPIVFVFLPKRDSDAIRNALAGHAAAEQTIRSRPAPATAEGTDAKASMESKGAKERAKLDRLIAGVLEGARIFQGGGNEVAEGSLEASVRSAAEAAIARLFPRFGLVDHPGWGNVVKKAREGAPDSLAQVGHAGDADKHPACQEVRTLIGPAGKKGSEVRKHFQADLYGWPQDAVDGVLLALLAGGFLRATLNAQAVTARQFAQSQVGVVDFYSEGTVIQTQQRLAVRGLLQKLGLPVKAGEEGEAIPRLLERLKDLASRASGEPPVQLPPSTEHIDKLIELAGNEQFVAVYEAREQLLGDYQAWSAAEKAIGERLPLWERLRRLLRHAESLPVSGEVMPQVDAISAARTLLGDPDPVAPLTQRVVEELRGSLTSARARVIEARERELEALFATTDWQQLPEPDRESILAANSLGPMPELQVGDADSLLATLDASPLSDWEEKLMALPGRAAKAREQAAKSLEPKAVRVKPKPAKLRNAAEVDDYLAALRTEIMGHIDDGNPVIF
jgi:hypothetical protein